MIGSASYALILLDVTIPDPSGIDLLYSLGALARGVTGAHHWLPDVIALTAGLTTDDMPPERLAAIAPGLVKCVVRKPIDVRELSTAVAPYLSRVGCDESRAV